MATMRVISTHEATSNSTRDPLLGTALLSLGTALILDRASHLGSSHLSSVRSSPPLLPSTVRNVPPSRPPPSSAHLALRIASRSVIPASTWSASGLLIGQLVA
mmetsp:Transcript_28017/g.56445  ORF Transcript_28017/g.56445 Transcript_28017/m.56445 type:complete len:103 (+) Transcript_28017:1521-1829(+)